LGAQSDIPACDSLSAANQDPTACINTAQATPLIKQRDLTQIPQATINASTNQVKVLGVASLNAYLAQLALPPVSSASLSNNFLIDLHGSNAEYAVNFGILSSILALDSRGTSANATCLANLQFGGSTQTGQFQASLNAFIPLAASRTMCTLLQSMVAIGGAWGPTVSPLLHTHMFRAEAVSGFC